MKNTRKILLTFSIILVSFLFLCNYKVEATGEMNEESEYIFLSDLDYITENNASFNGWSGHSIEKDKNQDGGDRVIRLIVDEETIPFIKGISLHARGQAVYDIGELSDKYSRFIAYAGVDASRGTNGNLWIQISVSNDGTNWTSLLKTENMNGKSAAVKVDVNIAGYKYLKIYVDPIGANTADHCSIGNARLVTENFDENAYEYDKIHKVEYYDEILRENDIEYNIEYNYRLILEREFINKLNYWSIKGLAEANPAAKEMFDWILDPSENDRLEQIIEVGEIRNSKKFIDGLLSIYTKHKEDLKAENGYVYQKMMIAIAATYSSDNLLTPLSFGANGSIVPLERYETMKDFFDNDKLKRSPTNASTGTLITNEWFKDYTMPIMRLVMQDGISNIDLIWLNGYSREGFAFNFWGVPYISPNYNQPRFYDEANREMYDTKYKLSKYGVPYGMRVQRYWMVIEGGGICWNESRFGQALYRANGIPAVGAYQPGHEMFFNYFQDSNGNGRWVGRYGNWSGAGSTWGGGCAIRYPLNWQAKYFTDQNIGGSKGGTSSGYIYLAQANINRYEDYQKSLYYNLLANSYTDNNTKIEAYNKALEIDELNLDSYDYMISLYKTMSVKNEGGTITSSDWRDLATRVIENYTYYPVAMYDLTKVIRPYLDGADRLDVDRLEKEALTKATRATDELSNSGEGARTHANYLLGRAQPDPLTFSFDGENACKLVKNSQYQLAWGYSLDGGETFTSQIPDDSVTLTEEEIAKITAENDIIINFMGLSYTFRIDIEEGTLPIYNGGEYLYGNDIENGIMGMNDTCQWRYSGDEEWISYKDDRPDLSRNKSVEVRVGYTENKLPSPSKTFTFTEDPETDPERTYISVSNISLHAVSTQATNNWGSASYALDANYNTRWHSAWDGSDTNRFITVKFDKPRFISSVEYVPAGGGNGRIETGTIYGSMDGENWIELTRKTGLTYSKQANTVTDAIELTKDFNIEIPQQVQYVKIVADRTNGNWFAARAFNFYEDTTMTKVADLSFDGENKGKIILIEEFQEKEWQYSLDGGDSWKTGTINVHQLTDQEIETITEEHGIMIRIDGKNYLLKIKRTSSLDASYLYVNDLENRVIGLTNTDMLEWKIDDGNWKAYSEEEPIVTGNRKLYIRVKSSGQYLASESLEFDFTEDNQEAIRKYIPIKHLSVYDFVSETNDPTNRPYFAANAIDGNINTMWHTAFDHNLIQENKNAYYVIQLDEPKYISALEFYFRKYREGDPAFTKNAIVYVSMDAENWIEAGRIENCPQEENVWRIIDCDESVQGKYVKLEMETYDMFASVVMINLFEDTTIKKVAEFSFTGENAGKIVLLDEFENANYEYSLDGGNTWKTFANDENQLSKEEIKQITVENGIQLRIDGDSRIFKINISKMDKPVISAYLNDLENRLIGVTDKEKLEWKIVKDTSTRTILDNDDDWIPYDEEEPIVEGNAHLFVRRKAEGMFLPSDSLDFAFTADDENKSKQYIEVSRLSIASVSAEDMANNGAAVNAIDGDYNTRWLNSASATDAGRYIVIKFDKPIYLSAMDYVPHSENGKILSAVISGSMDGETFEEITTVTNWQNNEELKTVTFDEPIEVQYVKIFGKVVSYANSAKLHVGARMFNFYEDVSQEEPDPLPEEPAVATINYSTTEETEGPVIATLTFDKENITITSDGGATHTFENNGTFEFKYIDTDGEEKTIVAEVTWIVKNVDIGETGFNVVLKSSKTELYPGDEFEVDVDIQNLNVDKGLIAFSGQLEYDVDKLEKISVHSNKGSWNESVMSDKSFKFVTDSESLIKEDGNVLTIKFRVKDTLTEATLTDIKVKNIIASNGIKDIPSDAVQITLKIKKRITEITSDLYTVEEGYITRIPEGTTVAEFKEHINPKEGIVVTNKLGEELTEETIIATGMKLKAEELEFELVVIGDVNESGGVTTTDLAQLKLHYIGEEILTGARFKAADIDGNNKITITDLAKLKLMLIGEKEEV